MAVYKPSREGSEKTGPTDTLEFYPPEPRETKFLLFKPPSLWCFVMAALED